MFKDSTTACHFSFRSCLGLNYLFKSMFKDSPTAVTFPSCLGLNDLFKSMFKDSPTAGHLSLSWFK